MLMNFMSTSVIKMLKLIFVLSCISLTFALPKFQSKSHNNKIIGGSPVDITNHPYQLVLSYNSKDYCGASILSKKVALTAAHCVRGRDNSRFFVRAGSNNYNSGGQLIKVKTILEHPNFDPVEFDYDVALLFLNEDITGGGGPWATVTLSKDLDLSGRTVTISGYGVLKEGSGQLSVLHAVDLVWLDYQQCNSMYPPGSLTSRMICAAAPNKDNCEGDSGGPLVLQGTYEQVGIASWGFDCADPKHPGVYTSVASLYDWIADNAKI